MNISFPHNDGHHSYVFSEKKKTTSWTVSYYTVLKVLFKHCLVWKTPSLYKISVWSLKI